MKLFDKTTSLLQRVMDLRVQNQQVIAGNVANANTPGYTPVRLEFEKNLREAVNSSANAFTGGATHPAHFAMGGGGEIEKVQATVIRARPSTAIGDGNEVDINQEMVLLSENEILYEAASQMLTKKLGLVKYIAQETK